MRRKFRQSIAATVATGAMAIAAPLARAGDYSSPEQTLASYIDGVRAGNITEVKAAFNRPLEYSLPGPIFISTYKITKRIVYGPIETKQWNDAGTRPQARDGDVELEVLEVIGGRRQMYSYTFRSTEGLWKIYAYAAWGVD